MNLVTIPMVMRAATEKMTRMKTKKMTKDDELLDEEGDMDDEEEKDGEPSRKKRRKIDCKQLYSGHLQIWELYSSTFINRLEVEFCKTFASSVPLLPRNWKN